MRNSILAGMCIDNLSVENIQTQKDVTICRVLTEYFTEIQEILVAKKPTMGKALSNREVRALFSRIDLAITKRFGFKVKTVENSDAAIGTYTTPPNGYNVLAGNVTNNYDVLKQTLGEHHDEKVSPDDIDVKKTEWVGILNNYLRSVDEVDKQIGTSGITVGLKNARVYNYPDKASAIIFVNPVLLFNNVKLTPDEMTAIYIHEIGHIFTHLEYSSRTIRNTTSLIESIISEVSRDKKPLDAIKLAYMNVFDDDAIDASTTVATATVGVTGRYLKELSNMGDNTNANKDSERLADEFSVRFGQAVPLTSGLEKLTNHDKNYFSRSVHNYSTILIVAFVISTLLLIFLPMIGLLLVGALAIISVVNTVHLIAGIVVYALYTMLNALFSKGIDKDAPYDNTQRRVLRMKNELVRQLRTTDLDNDTIKALLSSIDTLVVTSKTLSSKDENIVYKMAGTFFNYATKQREMRSLDNAVNDLTNNNLHVAANKFKTI